MTRQAITVDLTEAEVQMIHYALMFRADHLNKTCIQGTGDDCRALSEIFDKAKGASITIAYKP